MSHHAAGLPIAVLLVAVGHELLTALGRYRPRMLLFPLGCGLLLAGLDPAVSPWPAGDLRTGMLQHLLVGMLAPLALALSAPVTLLLRTLPRPAARALGRLLHTTPVRVLANPWVALSLGSGGLLLLYGTPLYAALTRDPGRHDLVHLHFLLSGYLFAWVIAGPDPAPGRPRVPVRLVVLGVAVAVHAVLAQLMYAGLLPGLPAGWVLPAAERQGAAELMYYAGDIAELLLAFALVTTWRPGRRSRAVPNGRLHMHPAGRRRPEPG